jgi:hypothetical protein
MANARSWKDSQAMTYDPDEPRDERGRWTGGGGLAPPPTKPFATTMGQWAKYFSDLSRHQASLQMASDGGDVQVALAPNDVPENVEKNIKNTLQAMTGLDPTVIDELYESFIRQVSIFGAWRLEGIIIQNGVVVMTQNQLDLIRSTIDDMPPGQAKTAREALERGIQQGRVVIKDE